MRILSASSEAALLDDFCPSMSMADRVRGLAG